MPTRKEIVYPIFLQCCDQNEFSSAFEDLAYGKAPFGTYISKDVLICTLKDKEFTYSLRPYRPEYQDEQRPEKASEVSSLSALRPSSMISPSGLTEEITALLVTLRKDTENTKNIAKVNEYLTATQEFFLSCDWGMIRKKSDRDLFLEKYVLEMRKKYDLTYSQMKDLHFSLLTAISFKVITNADISFSGGEISSINGISFSPGRYTFEKCIYGE